RTGGFALAPQTSTWGDVSLGRSNRGTRTNPVQRHKHTAAQSRLSTNWVDSKNFSSNWGGLAIASAHGTGGLPCLRSGFSLRLDLPFDAYLLSSSGSMIEAGPR